LLVNKEEKDGIIECLYKSSNIIASEYDEKNKKLSVTFNYGVKYEYYDVIHRDYVRFEINESQGTILNKNLKKYEFKKIGTVDVTPMKEKLKELLG